MTSRYHLVHSIMALIAFFLIAHSNASGEQIARIEMMDISIDTDRRHDRRLSRCLNVSIQQPQPYHLSTPYISNGMFCSSVTYIGAQVNPSVCYSRLEVKASRITLAINPPCMAGVNVKSLVFINKQPYCTLPM
jgi:hypothetical protein